MPGTLEAARKHSKTAECQYNLESDNEKANRKQNTKRKHYSDVDNLDYLSEIEKQSQEQYDERRLPTIPTFPGGIFKKMHGNKSGKIPIHDRLKSSILTISKQNITEQKKYEKLDKFTLDSVSNVSDKWHSKSPGISMLQGKLIMHPSKKLAHHFTQKVAITKVMHLDQIGGRTVAETVKNVLSELMAKEVAQQINFEGRGGQKQEIKNMKILYAIYGAVQHNPFTKNATKVEISDCVKTWLRNSCDRKNSDGSGGRKRHTVDNSTNKRLRNEDSQLCDKEGENDADDDADDDEN